MLNLSNLLERIDFEVNMENTESWYIVKRNEGNCDILPSREVSGQEGEHMVEKWGPIDSREDAIARRVGLIRAGKCKPV